MGGSINCISEIRKGTEFNIKLNTKCKELIEEEEKTITSEHLVIISKKNFEKDLFCPLLNIDKKIKPMNSILP